MNFRYTSVNEKGEKISGLIAAANRDLAITSLQRRGLIVITIGEENKKSFFEKDLFERIPQKEVVILSRQIATLFEAQVSALSAFNLLSGNTKNKALARVLAEAAEDIQAGNSISESLGKHPKVFSEFYVNMVRAGEESGKLTQTFNYLADYLERQYALSAKTKNALIYPSFVIGVFITVMVLMFVVVIPKLSQIISDSGQEIPFYTQIIMNISKFLVDYGFILAIFVVALIVYAIHLAQTKSGKEQLDRIKLGIPALGDLYKKLYVARIADNMDTMLSSGIPITRAIEITASVVGNVIYRDILMLAVEKVKGGSSLSGALGGHPEIPKVLVQMIQVGEETGSIGSILKTLARFYKREVDDAVDTIVGLIEPIMIVVLGLGVGILLISVLVPIYNISGGIS